MFSPLPFFGLASAAALIAAGWFASPCSAGEAASRTAATNVRDYGARGDGVADDTAAIERAIRETPTGQVAFPRGNFRITRTIEIPLGERGRTSLSGMGGVGRVVMAGPGPAFRFAGTHLRRAEPQDFTPQVWERERMPQVEGLEIVGAHPEADGLEFFQTMQAIVHGVLIREVRHGIRLATRNRNVVIDATHIYNCRGVGIYFDHANLHQAVIQGSHISYCKGGGIKILGGQIRNIQITGNDIEYNFDLKAPESADIWFDVADGTISEGTIASNTIQGRPSPGGANIRFVGPPVAGDRYPISLWTISGNLIGNQTVNIHLRNARGIAITGNHIYTGVERTIILEHSQHIVVGQNSLDQRHNARLDHKNGITVRDCDGVVLSGLILDDAWPSAGEPGGAIEVRDSRETTITHCQIFEPRSRGIFVTGSRNTRIADNTIMERAGEPRMRSAIAVAGGSRNTVITGNLLGTGSEGDLVAAPGTTTASGNHPAVQ